jgi:hypothetical protein
MESQPGLQHDGDALSAEAADAAPAGEVRRMRITDPEAWHDLAERGTPRNG